MKVTRTAALLVGKPLKGASVEFCLNEAIPESQEDRELVATIHAETTNGKSEVVARSEPPFFGCPVTWYRRRKGAESIVMFSYQALRIIAKYRVDGLSRTQTEHYGWSIGQIEGRRYLGLISKDQKRALLVVSDRKTVFDLISVLYELKVFSDEIPPSIPEIHRAIANPVPETAELLIVRVKTFHRASEAFAKYAIPCLEDVPEKILRPENVKKNQSYNDNAAY